MDDTQDGYIPVIYPIENDIVANGETSSSAQILPVTAQQWISRQQVKTLRKRHYKALRADETSAFGRDAERKFVEVGPGFGSETMQRFSAFWSRLRQVGPDTPP